MKLTKLRPLVVVVGVSLFAGCDREMSADGATALDAAPIYATASTDGWSTHFTRFEPAERSPNNDIALLIKVKTALGAEPSLQRFALDAGVLDGVVTLYGEVDSSEQRAVAERIARRIQGVEEVKSGIAVIQRG